MSLQLNHIQHYPMGEKGIKVLAIDDSGEEMINTIECISFADDCICFSDSPDYYLNSDENEISIKYILRPLSDYKDVNSKAMNELNCDVIDMIRISELANQRIGLASVQYGVIEIMCDNHIDFNRLIESGLAVDINTL